MFLAREKLEVYQLAGQRGFCHIQGTKNDPDPDSDPEPSKYGRR